MGTGSSTVTCVSDWPNVCSMEFHKMLRETSRACHLPWMLPTATQRLCLCKTDILPRGHFAFLVSPLILSHCMIWSLMRNKLLSQVFLVWSFVLIRDGLFDSDCILWRQNKVHFFSLHHRQPAWKKLNVQYKHPLEQISMKLCVSFLFQCTWWLLLVVVWKLQSNFFFG